MFKDGYGPRIFLLKSTLNKTMFLNVCRNETRRISAKRNKNFTSMVLFSRVDCFNRHIALLITQHNRIHQTCRQLSPAACTQNTSTEIRGRNIAHWA